MMTLDPARRADLEMREAFHLVCPACEWIAVAPDDLHVDRSVRLVEHLAEVHPFYLAHLRIAIGHYDRTVGR